MVNRRTTSLVIGLLGVLTSPASLLWGQGGGGPRITSPAAAGAPASAGNRGIRARTIMESIVDAHTRGDYQAADVLLRQAQTIRSQLTPTEQLRLDEYWRRNQEAMAARQQVLEQLAKVEQAAQANRLKDVEPLLRSLRSSSFLNPAERQRVMTLNEQVREGSGRRWTLFGSRGEKGETAPTKPDADALLHEARQALEAQDYARAEALATESQRAGHHAIFPWSDTPAKLLREVQAIKARQAAAAHATQRPEPPPATSPMRQVVSRPNLVPPAPMERPAPTTREEVDGLVREARAALKNNQLEQAEALAQRARAAAHLRFGYFDDTPDKVLTDIQRVRESAQHERAAELLTQARKKLETGQLDEAERLTYQAETLRSSYPRWFIGERPDRLQAEIQARRKLMVKPQLPPLLDPVVKQPGDESRRPLPPSRHVAGTVGNSGGQATPVPQSLPLPSSAAGGVGTGVERGAEMMVQVSPRPRAELILSMPIPKPVPPTIQQAVHVSAPREAARHPAPGPNPEHTSLVLASNSSAADPVKHRACAWLDQAHDRLRHGELLSALQAAREAEACGAEFNTGEETPGMFIATLKEACEREIDAHLTAAQRLMSAGHGGESVVRFLKYAHALAIGFDLDTTAIDEWLTRAQSTSANAASAPDGSVQGVLLLVDAEQELKAGRLVEARTLAEEVYRVHPEMKLRASHLLAAIDEATQRRDARLAETLYASGVRAYLRHEYDVAGVILQKVDVRLLDERKQAHVREVMAAIEIEKRTRMPAPVPTPKDK